MPHLDAGALATDKEGLEFLKSVLEVPAGEPPRFGFEPRPAPEPKVTAGPDPAPVEPERVAEPA